MTWLNTVQPVAATAVVPYASNAAIRRDYAAYLDTKLRLNQTTAKTVKGLLTAFDVYIRIWPADFVITQSNKANIEQFVAKWSLKCTKFQAGREGRFSRCLALQDLTKCPMLVAGAHCEAYKSSMATSIEGYLGRLSRIFNWLLVNQQVAVNPVVPVLYDVSRGNRAQKAKQACAPDKRQYTVDEIRTLVKNTPPNIGMAIALGAKCLLRGHEIFKLRVKDFDFDARKFTIPNIPDYGNKRQGNRVVFYDGELHRLLISYLAWRDARVHNPDGTAKTEFFMVTYTGTAWSQRSFNSSFNVEFNLHGQRLGIFKHAREGKSHDLRAYGTTAISGMKLNDIDAAILRGDVAMGSRGRYDLFTPRLEGLWRQHMPVLGI